MIKTVSSNKYLFGLLAYTLATIAIALWVPPIAQNMSYHNFADNRSLFDIPNFYNVISNIPLIVTGGIGLFVVVGRRAYFVAANERWPYAMLFIGSILTGLGSGYYHLDPNNFTLLWDRLPMCIIFMSYFSAILMERVNRRAGLLLLFPLILIGVLGALHWEFSEIAGRGDLRFYGWVQFYPVSMIVLMVLFLRSSYSGAYYILTSFAWFTVAKLAEYFDNGIYLLTWHAVSGHTLKHLAAAMSIYSVIRYLKFRKIV